MEKVRLGIIGIGSMGTGHAGNVLKGMVPDMELTAVAGYLAEPPGLGKEQSSGDGQGI